MAILQFLFLGDGSRASSLSMTVDVGGVDAGVAENALVKKKPRRFSSRLYDGLKVDDSDRLCRWRFGDEHVEIRR